MNFFDANVASRDRFSKNGVKDNDFIHTIKSFHKDTQSKETNLKYVTVYELNQLLDKHIEQFLELNKQRNS